MFDSIEIKDVKNEIGQLIKLLRKSRKLSQNDLAKSLDVSRTTIQNLELGRNATIDTILKVLKEMEVLEQLNDEIVNSKKRFKNTKSLY